MKIKLESPKSAISNELSEKLSRATDNSIAAMELAKRMKSTEQPNTTEDRTKIINIDSLPAIQYIQDINKKSVTMNQDNTETKIMEQEIGYNPSTERRAISPELSKKLSEATDSILRANELKKSLEEKKGS